MRVFDLGSSCRCRVWIGELPPISFVGERAVSRQIQHVAEYETASFKCAAEIVIPRGARMLYGALGAEFASSARASGLTVEVNVCNESRRRFSDSLIAHMEEVSVGLPSEYVESVFSGAQISQTEHRMLSTGTLRFAYAAHGAVSSNAPLFRQLASCLTATKGEPSIAFDEQFLRKALLI